jgi:hypothetical protein
MNWTKPLFQNFLQQKAKIEVSKKSEKQANILKFQSSRPQVQADDSHGREKHMNHTSFTMIGIFSNRLSTSIWRT